LSRPIPVTRSRSNASNILRQANLGPAWLDNAHREPDTAVAAAYGWPADIGEEEALARLLALNLARTAAGAGAR
jgi:hypothetical protein